MVAKHQADRTVPLFLETGKKGKAFVELRAKAEKGDKAAQYDYLVAQLELGLVKSADARKRLEAMADLTADQKKKADEMLVDFDVQDILAGVTKEAKTRLDAGQKFLDMRKADRVPKGDREFQQFHMMIMDYCESAKDAPGFEEAYKALKDKYGDKMRKDFLQKSDERLKKLRGE